MCKDTTNVYCASLGEARVRAEEHVKTCDIYPGRGELVEVSLRVHKGVPIEGWAHDNASEDGKRFCSMWYLYNGNQEKM